MSAATPPQPTPERTLSNALLVALGPLVGGGSAATQDLVQRNILAAIQMAGGTAVVTLLLMGTYVAAVHLLRLTRKARQDDDAEPAPRNSGGGEGDSQR